MNRACPVAAVSRCWALAAGERAHAARSAASGARERGRRWGMLEVRFGADVVPQDEVIFPNNGARSAILTGATKRRRHLTRRRGAAENGNGAGARVGRRPTS